LRKRAVWLRELRYLFVHASRADSMISTEKIRETLPTIGIILAVGTLMSILGPYNSHALGVPGVWFYWTGLMAVGWISGRIFTALLERIYPDLQPLLGGLVLATLVTLPVSSTVIVIQAVMGPAFKLGQLPMVFFMVWVVSAAVTLVSVFMERARNEAAAAAAAPEGGNGVGRGLAEKLPPRMRTAPLLALQAEDHYLRVHTEAGDELILMRLSDAIAAVEGLDGARTHRSWWVARKAVQDVARADGRATLTLTNGVEAPVSRTYSPKLREAGWY
jgi:hypothetical protein